MRLSVYSSDSVNPYYNLAMEGAMLRALYSDECVLYLWQNERTVVIGRNQNALAECDLECLAAEGGRMARRPSGGGAVYHDLGNLNFSFLAMDPWYDVSAQCALIIKALASLGVRAEISGRNDIICEGRKISGGAFYSSGIRHCHHGTLLVNTDTERMARYLRVPAYKLVSKGVSSVRARVGNICAVSAAATVSALRDALIHAFTDGGRLAAPAFDLSRLNDAWVREETARMESWAWRFNRAIPFTWATEAVLPFGGIRLELAVDKGVIREAAVYSDAMDAQAIAALSPALTGCALQPDEIRRALPNGTITGPVRDLIIARLGQSSEACP